jgi:hypothetical protein
MTPVINFMNIFVAAERLTSLLCIFVAPPYLLPAFPPSRNDVPPYPPTGNFPAIPPSTSGKCFP